LEPLKTDEKVAGTGFMFGEISEGTEGAIKD